MLIVTPRNNNGALYWNRLLSLVRLRLVEAEKKKVCIGAVSLSDLNVKIRVTHISVLVHADGQFSPVNVSVDSSICRVSKEGN